MNDQQLHLKFSKLGQQRKNLTNELAYLLPEINRRKIYLKQKHKNIFEYARFFAGMSTATVEKSLRLGRQLKYCPALREKIKTKGVHKVALLGRFANESTDSKLADKVEHMSKRALTQYAKTRNYREKNPSSPGTKCAGLKISAPKHVEKITLEGELLMEFLKIKQHFEKEQKVRELTNLDTLKIMMKKLKNKVPQGNKATQEKQGPQKMREVSKESRNQTRNQTKDQTKKKAKINRYIDAKTKNAIISSTNGSCAYPECQRPYEECHHYIEFSTAKDHNHVIPVCKIHHEFFHNGVDKPLNFIDHKIRIKKHAYFASSHAA